MSCECCSDCHIMFRNDGAKHKGEWSRLDLQRNPAAFGKFALSALTAKLPPAAHTFYFRDEIGNISTSNIRYALLGLGKGGADIEMVGEGGGGVFGKREWAGL